MRRPLATSLVVAAALAAAAPAAAATRTVRIGDDWYLRDGSPPTVSVKKGTTVRWRWVGDDEHNVSVSRGPVTFRSDLKDSGTYSRRMRRKGAYKIICTIHQPDMRMTLKVR